MKIAVIGSRETPDVWNRFLYGCVSVWLSKHEIRSGLCPAGPDHSVTMAALHFIRDGGKPHNLKIYPVRKNGILNDYCYFADEKTDEERTRIVTDLHPVPDKLTEWGWGAHKRNLSIINGEALDDPVDLVVYAHKSKKVTGGTKIGVDYALTLDIPTFNVVHQDLTELFKMIT